MKVQEKYLDKFIQENTFVDIYTDRYRNTNFGFIIEYDDEYLVLEKISEEGKPDGIGVFIRENITRIRWGGNEIESTERLIDNSKRLKNRIHIDFSSTVSIINSLHEYFGYVTVHIQDIDDSICFIGQIMDIDDETLVMNEFGTRSSLDRKMIMISIADITLIEGGGEYEENLKRLMI